MKEACKAYFSSLLQILLVSIQTINLQHGRLVLVAIGSTLIGVTWLINVNGACKGGRASKLGYVLGGASGATLSLPLSHALLRLC